MIRRAFYLLLVVVAGGWLPGQAQEGPATLSQHFLPIAYNQYTMALDPLVDLAWRWGDINLAPGSDGIQVVDWDGDGNPETFVAHSTMIFAVRHAGDYRFEQSWAAPNNGLGWGIAELLPAAGQELWVIDAAGRMDIYQPLAFEPSSRRPIVLPSGAEVKRALMADLFSDGRQQVLLLIRVGGEQRLSAFAWPDLQQVWEYTLDVPAGSYGSPRMITASLDSDPAREVVLSYGAVIDPVQSVEQWFYNEGFGIAMQGANVDGDAAEELIAMSDWQNVTAFDVDLQTPRWQIDTGDNDSLLVADVTGSAFPEILVGEGQWGSVAVYDSQTQALLWNVQNPEHGVSGMGVGDADNDGELDLIWGSGWTSSGADHLYLTPVSRRQPTFTFPDYDGPYMAAPLQMDEDDALELVILTRGTNSGYGEGAHFVLDSLTGQQETDLRLDITSASSYYTSWWILLGNVDTDPGQELFLSIGNDLYLFDHTGARLTKRSFSAGVTPRWVGDVDGDGELELVGHTSNRVTVHAVTSLEYEWQSVTHSPGVSDLDVGDVDADGRMEIVFHGAQSSAKAYDGQTHLLDWQMPAAQQASGIAVGNADGAGNLEILVVENNTLKVYDGPTRALLHTGASLGASSNDQWDVNLVTMTFSPHPQLIVVGGGKAFLFRHPYDSTSAQILSDDVQNLTTSDTDGDGHLDLLFGQSLGVVRYRAREPFPDLTPPFARPVTPAPGATLVSRNAFAAVRFSEAMDVASITAANAQVRSGATSLPAALSHDAATRLLRLTPQALLPANAQITVWLGPGLLDEAGNGLDGNLNGVGGEPGDAVTWQFQTGSGIDESGPAIAGLTLTPNPAWAGMPVAVDAVADDTHPQAASTVMGAEYFLDVPGAAGAGTPLQAVDGRFDERQEEITVIIDTTGWTADRVVYVHALDSVGNWGAFSQVTLDIQPEAAANWPTYGQNAGHTGYNSTQSRSVGATLAWEQDLFSLLGANGVNRPLAQVAVANGVVAASVDSYFGAAGVVALDAGSGSERWRRTFTNKFSINPPTIAYGAVYFQQGNHGGDSFLFALNVLTGQEMWRSPFAAQWESYLAPTVSEGKVFVNGGYYGGMYGYDAFDGDQLWFVDLAQYDGWTPAYSQGAVYSCVGGRLAAWHPSYGTELWSLGLGSCGAVVPVIDNNVAFLVGGDGNLIAVDLVTRAEKWRLTGSFSGTPAVANNVVYALDGNTLRAYDSAGGALLWSYVAEDTLVGAPVVTDADIFIASESQTWVIDRATHALVWELDKGGWLTVANNQLFVAQQDGKLAVYDIAVE